MTDLPDVTEQVVTHRVVFTPAGLEGEVAVGFTVLDAARQLGVDLDSVCGGRGICGRCQIMPSFGSFPKWGLEVEADALSASGPIEAAYAEKAGRGKRPLEGERRLGCAAAVCGPVVIDVPEASQLHKQVIRKEINLEGLTVDPVTELRYVEVVGVAPPGILLRIALSKDWQIEEVDVPSALSGQIAAALDSSRPSSSPDGATGITVALRRVAGDRPRAAGSRSIGADGPIGHDEAADPDNPSRLVVAAVWPGFVDTAYGIAIDVGSTTIAGHLCDLATGEVVATSGRMNPQIRFGEDLMSRVSYVMMNPGGEEELTMSVRSALDELVGEMAGQAGIGRDQILELSIVGNPVMHHLLLGYDSVPLGTAPFILETDQAVNIPASEIEINCPNAAVYVAPCIAGHVGADTAAAIVAERPHHSDVIQLLVDVGTNAEIVLGNRDQLWAASSPTGPAFEGAQLSCGVRAAVGAIERVRIDPETLEPRFKVIGEDRWSSDPDFDPPETGIIGICGSGVIEVLAEMASAGILDRKGVIRPSPKNPSRVIEDGRTYAYVLSSDEGNTPLLITQNDVRAIQLAKAALKAGIDLLMRHAGISQVDDIRLAGAFGAHLDPAMAAAITLIPPSAGSVSSPGNSAGTGAVRLLLSMSERNEIEDVVRGVIKIETALEPEFQDLFVEAMGFPTAPEPDETPLGQERPRRRRRR